MDNQSLFDVESVKKCLTEAQSGVKKSKFTVIRLAGAEYAIAYPVEVFRGFDDCLTGCFRVVFRYDTATGKGGRQKKHNDQPQKNFGIRCIHKKVPFCV